MPSKSKTPVKAMKRPVAASKPAEMKRAAPAKVADLKPSSARAKKEAPPADEACPDCGAPPLPKR